MPSSEASWVRVVSLRMRFMANMESVILRLSVQCQRNCRGDYWGFCEKRLV